MRSSSPSAGKLSVREIALLPLMGALIFAAKEALYALPNMNATVYNLSLLWIRQDWLDNLGLARPETMEDVINIARAFTKDDPDQNGADDTYGLAFSQTLFDGTTSLVGLFNGYGAYPDHWIKLDDDRLATVRSSLLPGMLCRPLPRCTRKT